MTDTGNGRLDTLATFLDSFDATKGHKDDFDMGVWFDSSQEPGCGTTACALGWATTIPALRDAGLSRDEDGDPTFGGLRCLSAAAAFFEIDTKQSVLLFWPYSYCEVDDRSPKGVAARIRGLLAAFRLA
jgi:hypothetical protein